MQVLHERCCGLDVHKKTVVACVPVTSSDGRVERTIRTFGTMTRDLLALSDWLDQFSVTHIVLESTGVYWRPVFNVLEEGRVIVLVNPQHLKTVPGRKTDVKDSEWLADLLRHGLLKPSFIPPAPLQPLAPSLLLTPNGGCAAQDLDLLNSLRTGDRLLKRAERPRQQTIGSAASLQLFGRSNCSYGGSTLIVGWQAWPRDVRAG